MQKHIRIYGGVAVACLSISLFGSFQATKNQPTDTQISSVATTSSPTGNQVLGASSPNQPPSSPQHDQTAPTSRPTRSRQNTAPQPQLTPSPAPPTASQNNSLPPLTPKEECDINYVPCVYVSDKDLDCTDIGMVVTIKGIDIHHLDSDQDGTACEGYAHDPSAEEEVVDLPTVRPAPPAQSPESADDPSDNQQNNSDNTSGGPQSMNNSHNNS